jgi:GxxExxY protein
VVLLHCVAAVNNWNHGGHTVKENDITEHVIGAAIEVHRTLGPGLLESAYEECLCHELHLRRIAFERQCRLPLKYKGTLLDCGYRIDLLVEQKVVVECKAVDTLLPIHEAQLLTYLKLGQWRVGLLLNFNVELLKHGVKRMVLDFDCDPVPTP